MKSRGKIGKPLLGPVSSPSALRTALTAVRPPAHVAAQPCRRQDVGFRAGLSLNFIRRWQAAKRARCRRYAAIRPLSVTGTESVQTSDSCVIALFTICDGAFDAAGYILNSV